MVNPSLAHSNKSTHKISLIFVKMLQALFRDFYASAFLICCDQAQHPSCAKLYHIQFFMQNISYMFFRNAYSLSNFTHFHQPVIQYHIVHLFNDFWCYVNKGPTRCNSMQTFIHCHVTLHVSGVTHPSSGVLKTVSATSGVCRGKGTVTSFHRVLIQSDSRHDGRK